MIRIGADRLLGMIIGHDEKNVWAFVLFFNFWLTGPGKEKKNHEP